jgi:hypothetical protein
MRTPQTRQRNNRNNILSKNLATPERTGSRQDAETPRFYYRETKFPLHVDDAGFYFLFRNTFTSSLRLSVLA